MTDEQFAVHDETGVLDDQRDATGIVVDRIVQVDHLLIARVQRAGGQIAAAGRAATAQLLLRIGPIEHLLVVRLLAERAIIAERLLVQFMRAVQMLLRLLLVHCVAGLIG